MCIKVRSEGDRLARRVMRCFVVVRGSGKNWLVRLVRRVFLCRPRLSGLEHTSRRSTPRPLKSAITFILDLGSPNRPQHAEVAQCTCEGWLASPICRLPCLLPSFSFLGAIDSFFWVHGAWGGFDSLWVWPRLPEYVVTQLVL